MIVVLDKYLNNVSYLCCPRLDRRRSNCSYQTLRPPQPVGGIIYRGRGVVYRGGGIVYSPPAAALPPGVLEGAEVEGGGGGGPAALPPWDGGSGQVDLLGRGMGTKLSGSKQLQE